MRRTLTIALGTAAALVTAAVAFAVVPAVVGVSVATATFETTTIDRSKTSSCTVDLKIWETTHGHYKGSVTSGNAVLAGVLSIHAKTTYNTTDGLGYVNGSFKIKDDDSRVKGTFAGTIKNGKLVGYLTGKSRGNHAKVLGNLSADFAGGATNVANGQIGSTSSLAVLAVVAGPVCKAPKEPKPAKRVHAEGTATLAGGPPPTSITVTPKHKPTTAPCAIPASFVLPAGVVTSAKVEMVCEWVGTPAALTLTKVELDT